MTPPFDPPPMSHWHLRRLRWAQRYAHRGNRGVDRWIADLARSEDPGLRSAPAIAPRALPDQLVRELGGILAHEEDVVSQGEGPDAERSVWVPVPLIAALLSELEAAIQAVAGPIVTVEPSEALASALAGGSRETDWARSEAARVLGELARSGWQLAQVPSDSEGTAAT